MNGDKAKASGPASVAIGGDADGAQVTTSNFDASGAGTVNITQNYAAPKDPSPQRLAEPINNLPEVAADFTGRVEEENTIVAALSREGGALTISALKGIGGIGKTALAIKIAHRLTALFPAAQLLVDLRGTRENPVSSRQAMESVIRRFHPEAKLPDDDAAIAEIYRDLLRRNKAILILDNAKDTAQAAPLLPPFPSAAMVTSRQALFLEGARSVRLDDLPLAEAKELLAKIFATERSCPEGERTELAQACLCHPLSLRVAALFLKHHKGWTIAAYVRRVGEDREQLKIEGVADHDVMAVLGQSLRQLEAEDAGLAGNWRDLSVFPADFDPAAAAAVWEIADIDAAIDRLASLETKGFLDAIAADRYRLHDLMRDLARRGRPEERTGAVALRHARHFGQVLGDAGDLYQKGGDGTLAGLALFDRERTNIEAGRAWAAARIEASQDAAALAARYADAGAYILSLRLHPREWIAWGEAALKGYRATGNRRGEGNALGNLGVAYADLGETRKAIDYHEQRLIIAREIGDRRGEGNALGNLGLAYADLGETRKAIDNYEQALIISRETGDRRGEGNALGNLGVAYKNLGETRKAIDYHEQYLVIAREIGDRRGEGNALGNLGVAYKNLGETRKAIDYHEQHAAIAREIGDRRGEGNVLTNMGLALRATDPEAARANLRQALAIFTAIEDPNAARVAAWLAELDGPGA